MPQHYISSIFVTSKRLQTREGIQLFQQSYLRFSPKNKRERNGFESVTGLNHHKEAIPSQSVFKLAQHQSRTIRGNNYYKREQFFYTYYSSVNLA
jgi:hypothetical protein